MTTSVKDYVSIDHLGIILEQLSKREVLDRVPPTYLSDTHPNMVVCPSKDMLSNLLSIYMASPNKQLPTQEEVLLCTEETSLEEIDLLILRAAQDKTGRIFCIANVELLKYDTAEATADCIENHTQGLKNYNIVLLCSSEGEHKSPIAAALDQHRVDVKIMRPLREIQNYVFSHLPGNLELSQTDHK